MRSKACRANRAWPIASATMAISSVKTPVIIAIAKMANGKIVDAINQADAMPSCARAIRNVRHLRYLRARVRAGID